MGSGGPSPERSAAKSNEAGLTPLRVFCDETPIIPAIRKPEYIEQAVASRGKLVYLLTGDPENIEMMIRQIVAADKSPLVNLDLLNGFSRDRFAVNYLKKVGAHGIISTHLDPLRHALAIGMYAVQRTFLLDSGAMDTIANQLRNTPVHALEILPAMVAPKILERVRSIQIDLPVVGGGLIQTMKEVEELLAHGLSAVSTSNPQMWLK
jgi:glycerol uptake operon antiterminator